MNPLDLLSVILSGDALAARQWIADAERADLCWSDVEEPTNLEPGPRAVFAGLVELLAARHRQRSPAWTARVGRAPERIYLVHAATKSARMRARLERESPEPLRKRNVLAPPNYLTVA